MEVDNILKIIDKVSDRKLSYFSYEEDGKKIVIKSKNKMSINKSDFNFENADKFFEEYSTESNTKDNIKASTKDFSDEDINQVKSPIVGTFYSSATEGGEPFVKVGDTVTKGQVIGIIEAMKIMNDIESPYDGVIASVDVTNGQTVEYGQLLYEIK